MAYLEGYIDCVIFCCCFFLSRVHSNLKAINLNLESRHDEAKCEIAELNKKLASKTNTAENYEVIKQDNYIYALLLRPFALVVYRIV